MSFFEYKLWTVEDWLCCNKKQNHREWGNKKEESKGEDTTRYSLLEVSIYFWGIHHFSDECRNP